MEVKFLDLAAGYKQIQSRVLQVFQEICEDSEFVGGESLACFEQNFSKFLGVAGCVGVGNGTDALEIALRALELPAQSEVILPANTFFASLEAVLHAGLRVRLIDCGEDYLLDTQILSESLMTDSKNVSAIMPVHLYGQMCDMYKIMDIARQFGLQVIEDASQAHGAFFSPHNQKHPKESKAAGSFGAFGCFSFYPSKNLGAFGDGGAIVSHNQKLLEKVRMLANHGVKKDKYYHECIGRNSRLDNLQAAILNLKLEYLEQTNERRKEIAKIYNKALSSESSFITPSHTNQHVYHLYVLRLGGKLFHKRDELRRYLSAHNIESGVHYPFSLSSLPAIQSNQAVKIQHTPRADDFAKSILSLPMGEHLSDTQVLYVCDTLLSFAQKSLP